MMSNKDDKNLIEETKDDKVKTEKQKEEERVERAKKIAARKESLKSTLSSIETSIKSITSWFSKTIDKFIFSHRYDKIISISIACILYITINFSNKGLITYDSTYTIQNHPVTLNADLDVFEVTGYEKEVDVVITGKSNKEVHDARRLQNSKVVLDLSGLQTGVHTVKFTPTNFSSKVSVMTLPESATVTIRKKETVRFKISHDFLNLNKMEEKFYPGTPEFESNEVLVSASSKTIDEIAYVKALIDLKDATETFTTEAPLYAYNSKGEQMNVDIIPRIVKVKVPISSPSKSVKVSVVPQGLIPNDMSIDSISMDHNSANLYGSQEALDGINEVKVNIDATRLESNRKLNEKLVLPSGVRHADISSVNIDVKLDKKESKVLSGIPVSFINNINGYKTKLDNPDQADVDITIYGTKKVLEDITADNFGKVYFDMSNVSLGDVSLPLIVDTTHYLVSYDLEFENIKMKVVD